jgi:hypothetical protein
MLAPAPVLAQQSVSTVVSNDFDISHGWYPFVGRNWRDVWISRIVVPVFDPGSFAGGLTPFRTGGNQTHTLWFHGADGRTYIFRSTAKAPSGGLNPDLRHGLAGDIVRDELSGYHPGAALIAEPLERAAGVRTTTSHLGILPSELGADSLNKTFGGKVGEIEDRPEAGHGNVPTPYGADDIKSTEAVANDLDQTLRDRIDTRAYLAARLVDALIGDPDRGCDQWRWAEYHRDGGKLFVPIARDRDHAFARTGGMIYTLLRDLYSKETNFDAKPPSLGGMTFMTTAFDRSELVDLDWTTWDSVTKAIQHAWTNAAIDSAVHMMPQGWVASSGDFIAASLKARRDKLPDYVRKYFEMVNGSAVVFGSDESDRATVDRLADGSVTVRMEAAPPKGSGDRPVAMVRHFAADQTSEIRIYLEDGADTVLVRGGSKKGNIVVRVIGGNGDDVLTDSSTSGHTIFYDRKGQNHFTVTGHAEVDRSSFTLPHPDTATTADSSGDHDARTPRTVHLDQRRGRFLDLVGGSCIVLKDELSKRDRDWGTKSGYMPLVNFPSGYGIALGLQWTATNYSFRRFPYQSRFTLAALGTPLGGGAGAAKMTLDLRPENSDIAFVMTAEATQFHTSRFFGFGNESPTITVTEAWLKRNELTFEPAVRWYLGSRSWFSLGGIAAYRSITAQAGSPGDSLGPGILNGSSAGARFRLAIDRRDNIADPRYGFTLGGTATWYPKLWDVPEYGRAEGYATAYVSLGPPTLALRVTGVRIYGDQFPLYDAAMIGGRTSLRGLTWDRYAGDADVVGTVELRIPLFHMTILDRGKLGLIGFEDAGRVWYRGASEGGWHRGTGGGFSFTTVGMVGTLVYAHSDGTHVYVSVGFPF